MTHTIPASKGSEVIIRGRTGFAAAALLFLCGCTDLTEFDNAVKAGINIMYPPDFSVVHTIEGIPGARSLCVLPDCFIVATTEGTVISFDLESYHQTGSFTIGIPSPSGYFEMEYCQDENSVYIVGALGQIVEISVPEMEFIDCFTICETPVDIEIASGKPFFYVADASLCRIYEVSKENNASGRFCLLESSPTCMAIAQSQDTILVGTLDKVEIVSIVTETMFHRTSNQFPVMLAIETIPDDTTFCAVFDYSSTKSIATILNYITTIFSPTPVYCGKVNIDGDIHYICADPLGSHAYVLSYLGDNTSRLVSYNCSNYNIESQVDLPGYPLDLEIGPEGTLLILTAE